MPDDKTLRDCSRRDYRAKGARATCEELNVGSLQRIANSLEQIAADKETLERNLEDARRTAEYWCKRASDAESSNAALRGVITRMRRKHEAALRADGEES
jgi:hypothetical protein